MRYDVYRNGKQVAGFAYYAHAVHFIYRVGMSAYVIDNKINQVVFARSYQECEYGYGRA